MRLASAVVALAAVAIALTTIWVERESQYARDVWGQGGGRGDALVLYHPSRDAHFSDELSVSVAEGLREAGFVVERMTLTSGTPAELTRYAIVCVVSNTYYWSPDLPTRRFLRRANLTHVPAIGIIAGAGSTDRAQRVLESALFAAGAQIVAMRSVWLWRPNDEQRMNEPNRQVASDMVRRLARESGDRLPGR